jgi:hypothetical protein
VAAAGGGRQSRVKVIGKRKTVSLYRSRDAFARYIQSALPFCPLLQSSLQYGLCFCETVQLDWSDPNEAERDLFFFIIEYVIKFKRRRKEYTDERSRLLYCENIVVIHKQKTVAYGERTVPWVHWMLKLLYTEENVIVGDFWDGESTKSQRGEHLPVPSINFLSIRSLIARDYQFFRDTPRLLSHGVTGARAMRHTVEEVHGAASKQSRRQDVFKECRRWAEATLSRQT